MVEDIDIKRFFELIKKLPVVDVRSPGEFSKGHIPGSVNIPLFSDSERAHIGTVYKQNSSEEAVKLGESYANPKIGSYLKSVDALASGSSVIVTCLRGGMRSGRFSRLLDDNGYDVYRLEKGYKNYRNYIHQSFSSPFPLIVLGGMTGTGKTEILQELRKIGEQIIDLEQIANHRGSAFGGIGQDDQPTTEQFENNIFQILSKMDPKRRIWVEDESRNIGKAYLPEPFFEQIRKAPLIILELGKKYRAMRSSRDYGSGSDLLLIEGINKINRRLGGEKTKKAIEAVNSGNYYEAAFIVLDYYDKSYSHNSDKKMNISMEKMVLEEDDPAVTANLLLERKIF